MKYASKFGPAIAVLFKAAKHYDEEINEDEEEKESYWLYFGT